MPVNTNNYQVYNKYNAQVLIKPLDIKTTRAKVLHCMEKILQIIEVVLAVILIISVLLQQRGSGLGGAFGSNAAAFSTRRGFDKFLYYTTIVTGTLFVLVALATVVVVARQL